MYTNSSDIASDDAFISRFNEAYRNIFNTEAIAELETDSTPSYVKKAYKSALSVDALSAMVQQKTVQKTLNMDGFSEQEIEMVDPDSGYIINRDANGNVVGKTAIRLHTYGHYDGVDSLKAVEESRYKQLNQPEVVAKLVGKPVYALTDYDYANVKAYASMETMNAINHMGKDMYQTSPFNPYVDYTSMPFERTTKAMVRISGKDKYNRTLAEVVNPNNSKDIAFELSKNPYINASFDPYKVTATKRNQAAVDNFYSRFSSKEQIQQYKSLIEAYDTDNRILEDLDMAQASAYRMFARLAQYGPSAIMDTDYWARVADEATGQQLADAWAGIKPSTRRAAATEMAKSIDYWKQGNYFKAVMQVGSQLDRILADSAAQTVASIAVGVVTGGIGLAAGASTTTASTIAMVSGGVASAVDNTLNTMEQFEANNGRKMNAEEAASTFAGFLVWAVPEAWLTTLGVGKLMPKVLSSAMHKAYKDGAKMSAGKLVATSAFGEAGQESLESGWETYKSQNQANAQSFGEVYTSPENAISTVSGLFMGGALSGVPAAVKLPFEVRKEKVTQDRVDAQNQHNATHTLSGTTNVDTAMSDLVMSAAKEFANKDFTSDEDLATDFNNLRTSMSKPGISKAAIQAANRAVHQQFLRNAKAASNKTAAAEHFAKITGQTVEDLFNETVFYSDYNAEQVFAETGKQVTPEHATKVKEELEALGKELGLSEEVIKKSLEEVIYDVRHGSAGYQSYAQNIANAITQLSQAEQQGYTEEQKLEIVSTIISQIANLHKMLRISGKKITAFTDAFNRYVDNDGDENKAGVRYTQKDKDDFLLRTDELADLDNSSRENVRGMYRFLEALETEHNDVKELISKIPADILSYYKQIEQSVSETEQTNNTMEASIDGMRNALKAASTLARDKKLGEAKAKRKSPMNPYYAKQNAYQLAKGIKNKTHRASTLTSLRLLSSKELEAVKKDLERENTPDTAKAIQFIEQAIQDVLEVEALRESRKNAKPASSSNGSNNLPAVVSQGSNVPAVVSDSSTSNLPATTSEANTAPQLPAVVESDSTASVPAVTSEQPTTPETPVNTGSDAVSDTNENKDADDSQKDGSDKKKKKVSKKKKTEYSEETKERCKKLLAAVANRSSKGVKQLSLVSSKYDQLVQEYSGLSDDEFNELVNYVAKSKSKNKDLLVKAMKEIRQKRINNKPANVPSNAPVSSTPAVGVTPTPTPTPSKVETNPASKPKTEQKVNYTPDVVKGFIENIETTLSGNANSILKAYRTLYKKILEQFNAAENGKKQTYVNSINLLIKSYETYSSTRFRNSEALYQEFVQAQHDEAVYIVKTCEQLVKSIDENNAESIVAAINVLTDSLYELADLKGIKLRKHAGTIAKELKQLNRKLADIFVDRNLVEIQQNADVTNEVYMSEMLDEYYNAVASLDLNVLNKETIEAIRKPIIDWKKADKNRKYRSKCDAILDLTRSFTNEIGTLLSELEAKDEYVDDSKPVVSALADMLYYGAIDRRAYDVLNIDGASTNEQSVFDNIEELLKDSAKKDENTDEIINNTVTALVDFNTKLIHTLRARNNPACTLASEGVSEEVRNKGVFIQWSKAADNAIKSISYSLANHASATSFLKYDLPYTPHFRLLYNIHERKKCTKDGELVSSLEFERNDLVWQVLAFSAEEYISQMDMSALLSPKAKNDVCKAFGLNSELVTREELQNAYKVIKAHGVPDRNLAEMLGNIIMENLGLSNNTADEQCILGDYERIRSGLGAVAIQYLAARGVLKFDSFTWTNANGEERIVNSIKEIKETSSSGRTRSVTARNITQIKEKFLGKYNHKTGERDDNGVFKLFKKEKSSFVKEPSTKPSKRLKTIYVRKTDNLVEVAAPKQVIMNKLQQQAFKIDHELIEDLAEITGEDLEGLKQLLLDRLGYVSEESDKFNQMTADDKLSQEGKNADIEKQIDILFKWHRELRQSGGSLYFNYFESRNNRMFIDSNDLNPQTGKQLQRFLCVNDDSTVMYDFSQDHEEHEAFAIAQAFDSIKDDKYIYALGRVVNTLSKNADWLTTLQKDLMTLTDAQFKDKYANIGVDADTGMTVGFGGIENFGQCLSTVMHLKRKQAANGKPFLTYLTIENDSTTSGYAIRFTQFPVPELIKSHAPKVGILTQEHLDDGYPKDTMHMLKRLPDFDDIYKTTAKKAIAEVNKINPDKLIEFAFNELDEKSRDPEASSRAIYTVTKKVHTARFFKILAPSLPQLNPDGKVSSALRNLMKPPTMTFGYTAGIKSIKRVIAEEVMYQHFSYYQEVMWAGDDGDTLDASLEKFFAEKSKTTHIKEETKAELTAICKAVEYLEQNYTISADNNGKPASYATMWEALHFKFASEIKLTPNKNNDVQFAKETDHIGLTDMYLQAIGDTYGQAVWDVLAKDFEKYQEINGLMNTTGTIMAQLYTAVYDAEMQRLNEKYNGRVPMHAYKELLQRLTPLLPTIPLLYDDRPNTGTPLFEYENAPAKDYPVVNPIIQRTEKGYVTNPARRSYDARMKRPTDAGLAGAVTTIHAQDGTIMALTANRYPNILAIHDAVQVSAFDAVEPTKFMNMCTIRCGQSFNLLEEMANRLVQVANNYDEYCADNELYELKNSRKILVPALNRNLTANLNSMLSSMLAEFEKEADTIGYQEDIEVSDIASAAKRTFQAVVQEDNAIVETNNNPELAGTFTNTWKNQVTDLSGEFYGVTDENGKNWIPLERFLMGFAAAVRTNNEWRDDFYNNVRFITNVDGAKGSGYEFGSAFQQDVYPLIFKSDPESFVPNEKLAKVLQEANTSMEERVNFLDYLQALDRDNNGIVLDEEHLQHLKTVIAAINPENIKRVQVSLEEGRSRNVGKFDPKTDIIHLGVRTGMIDEKTRLAPLFGKSSAEVYAHELKHAAMYYATAVAKIFNADKYLNAIADLAVEAGKHLTWKIFMPENVPVGMEAEFEQQARNLFNHIFNNPDQSKNMMGVHEFATFGTTNKAFMDALKSIEVPVARDKTGKVRLLDRLISTVLALFDLVFANKSSREEAKETLKKVWRGEESLRKRKTVYEELVRLDAKITGLNFKTVNKLAQHPARFIEAVANLLHKIVTKTNKGLIPVLNFVFNIADKLPIKIKDAPSSFRSGWHKFGYGITAIMLMAFSKKHRQGLKLVLQKMASVNNSIDLALLLKDVSEPDLALSRLEFLSMKQRNAEQSSKDAQAAIANSLREAFGKSLNDMEATALTQAVLYTDLQALYTGSNITEVHKMLTDDEYLQKRIDSLEVLLTESLRDLKAQKLDVPSVTWIKNQAKSLAYYQLTGRGNEALCTNATLIITKGDNKAAIDSHLESLIDMLTTCYALQLTESSTKKLVSTLNIKGLEHTLVAHKEWIKSSLEGVLVQQPDKAQGVYVTTKYKQTLDKGYTKSMLDDFYDMRLDFVDNAKQLSNEGFVLVEELPQTKATTAKPMAVYRRSFASPKRRLGATFALRGVEAIATDLKSAAISAANHDKTDIDITDERFRRNVQAVHDRYVKLMETKELSMEEIKRMSGGFIPCLNKETLEPDFRVSVPKEVKTKHFSMDTNGIHVLSAMYAQQNTNAYGKVRNEVVLQYLYMMQDTDMTAAHRSQDGMYKYVKLEPDGKFLTKVWDQVPIEVLKAINKKPLWVREDWLPYIFGVEKISVANAEFLQKKQTKGIRYALVIAEHILQAIAQLAKQNIVIRVPAVLIGNIISNINYSILQGHNPVKIVRKQLENAAAIRNYVDDKRALTRLEMRKRLGIATTQEVKDISLYKAKLRNNKVHPLMEKGMYQSIVEDLSPEDIAANGKFAKAVKRLGVDKKTPTLVKNTLRHLYMAEGTPIYDLLFQATQYSDFVARATEYQLRMEQMEAKIDKQKERSKWFMEEQKISAEIVNAFINYDKPQAPLLEYANSLGLFMFTKFALRIQPIIFKTVLNNPAKALMFLASQHVLWDSDDILEQNVFNKSLYGITHSPLDNLANVAMPMLGQFALGQRNPF